MLTLLSQRDGRWSQLPLGGSKLTVGRFGCTTTALSMLTQYFGHWMNPAQIASHKDWYTKDGLILWQNLNIPGTKFVRRDYGRHDLDIQVSMNDPGRGVLLQVNDGQHWVLALRKDFWGRYIAADPWTGKECAVLKTYKNITGAAHFKRG